jgi:hypothetical protein
MAPILSVQHGEAFLRLRVQDVTEFDSDICSNFCLMEGKKKKRERETARTGLALLVVLQVAAIRCI